ncbi:helix-turn-helix domain-containing protein [Microvirga massiliensis]|uniref:helix-turn-helix domain-containing protein n=1 Tax=Microvirga massiliensis TaxID=1033741 RepID=UPI00062B3EC4|nr:helix-turn-helix domain-containing protein [Microvirga massiliensis]
MLGSQLLERQPFFRGSDFGMPELAVFGMCHFRRAVVTNDSWEAHDGTEILFMLNGEACWEFDDERLFQVTGGQALVFQAGSKHRIVNGIYTPSQALWMVFNPRGQTARRPGLMPQTELESLFAVADRLRAPVDLDAGTVRTLKELSHRLGDDRIFLGVPLLKAEIRNRLHAAIVGFWAQSANKQLTTNGRRAIRSIEEGMQRDLASNTPIDELAKSLGYGHSQLYALFKREFGMSPNDYRQRLRIKRCCTLLLRTNRAVTDIALELGFGSSQYFARVFKKYVGVTPSEYRRLAASALSTAE